MATDAELNQYVGVKRYAPYRKPGANKWDSQRNDRLRELRDKIKERGGPDVVQDGDVDGEKKKRKGKKERMREKAAMETAPPEEAAQTHDADGPKKKKKRKKAQAGDDE